MAVFGFGPDHIENFDPAAVSGFGPDQVANFDPTAMLGFDPTQVENFDPTAMPGFAREHMTNMELDALAAFDISQVENLDELAIAGIGDTVPEFDDFDVEVRFEVVGEEALRLGGVGSFEELAEQIAEGPSPEDLEAMGWDPSLGNPEDFDFSAGVPEGLTGEALARATEAFNSLQ